VVATTRGSKNDEMLRRIQKVIEARTGKVRMAEAKGREG